MRKNAAVTFDLFTRSTGKEKKKPGHGCERETSTEKLDPFLQKQKKCHKDQLYCSESR